MSLFSLGALLAAIVWQGESIPTNNDEAIELGYVCLTKGDYTGTPRESSYNSSDRWSDKRFPHADAMYFNAAGYILSPNVEVACHMEMNRTDNAR